MKRIHKTYADVEIHDYEIDIKCPNCGDEFLYIGTPTVGEAEVLTCENEECEEEFEMFFDVN